MPSHSPSVGTEIGDDVGVLANRAGEQELWPLMSGPRVGCDARAEEAGFDGPRSLVLSVGDLETLELPTAGSRQTRTTLIDPEPAP